MPFLAGAAVKGNVFRSQADPKIEVRIDRKLRYVGLVAFQIRTEAKGTRYVFVQADANKASTDPARILAAVDEHAKAAFQVRGEQQS